MTEYQRYIAEEIAVDHSDGIISRREAIALGLLGLTAAAASALLAGAANAAPVAPAGAQRHDGVTVDWAPEPTEAVTFPGPNGALMAAWAPAAEPPPLGGVLVVHENRGLNDHIRSVASRFAASGYSALALDLLSEEGGTGSFPDEAAVAAALATIPPQRFDADMMAAVTELETRLPHARIGAIGFCFGGGMVWRLLAAGERRLAAAAPFYGPFPSEGDLSKAKAAVWPSTEDSTLG